MMFDGFGNKEFAIFELPGYAARMPMLRQEITPRLKALAEDLTPKLAEATGLELHPHVAAHMRRTVNPPEETWAAFGRSPRSYKPFVHYRVAINAREVKVSCFIEDDADDKPAFAAGLAKHAKAVSAYLHEHPEIHSYDLLDADGCPTPGDQLAQKAISAFGKRLQAVKGQHASFAIRIPAGSPELRSGRGVIEAACAHARTLLPFYRLGLGEPFTA